MTKKRKLNPPKVKGAKPENQTKATKVPVIKKILKHWGFVLGLIIGLVPYAYRYTPLNIMMHPISISSPSIAVIPNYDTISYFQVTNNSDMTLYQIQIRFDLPQGLSTNDVPINKMTRTDDTTVNLDGVIWDTSIFMEDGTSGNHDIIIMHLDRVLPGDSNIVAFSLDTNAATVSQPIKISCAGYSKKQSSILTQ